MRKILIAALAASTLVPAMASAQSAGEVRRGQQEVQRDMRDVRQAQKNGDWQKAQRARQEAREDQREVNEDWRDYRKSHRQVYQRGTYNAPRGMRYRPVTVGYNFQPAFYSSRYQLTNYNTYRLPNPGYNHRWVRYGNDAVMVDIRNGRVLRVISGFFW
ncbi:MAG: RcnB family protein [Novosphingobium sp.]